MLHLRGEPGFALHPDCHHPRRQDFEYLVSDMNTHTLHLLKTFKALLDLSPKTHQAEPQTLRRALAATSVDGSFFDECFQKLNTPAETPELRQQVLSKWDQVSREVPN
jgi:hypothetical protein